MVDIRYTVQMRNVKGEWKTIVDCTPDREYAVSQFETGRCCGATVRLMRSTVELVDSCIDEDPDDSDMDCFP